MSDSFEPDLRQGLRARATRVGRPENPAADVRRRLRRQDTVQRSLAAVGVFAVLALVGVAGVPLLGGGGIELDSSPPASQPDEPDGASDPVADESSDDDGAGEEDAAACSAAGLAADADPQPALPTPAAETREQLIRAAAACDYEALAAISAAPDGLSFTFGGGDDPVAHWREAEASGDEPMRALVEILRMPHASRNAGDTDMVVWPAAYARESWADVSAEEREALRALYGEEDLERFAQFGSYIGYRVGIRADGTWMFFVAGD